MFDDLVRTFGEDCVFMDVAGIQAGRDFRQAIRDHIGNRQVLLALIGPRWLEAADAAGGLRLQDPNDFVGLEIASALERQITIIPVLVRGAKMPQAEQLPANLANLAYRNAIELTHARWKSDVQLLISGLQAILETKNAVPQKAETVDVETLARLSRRLAHYIGPVAEVVVKRASKRCASLAEIAISVAEEIEVNADRTKFLESYAKK